MSISLLQESTKSAHADLERTLIPALKKISSPKDYSEILQLFYGYFHPLESKVLEFLDDKVLPDIASRRQSAWIIKDLEALDIGAITATCSHMPTIDRPAQAWGAMYVMEGSTLGGVIISKMISSRLAGGHTSLEFFNGYGNDTTSRWSTFLHYMNTRLRTGEDWKSAISTANQTFIELKKWAANRLANHSYVGN